MVTLRIISEYDQSPPAGTWSDRQKIAGGPLYDLGRVVRSSGSPSGVFLVTGKAIADAQKAHSTSGEVHDSDTRFVAALIAELGNGSGEYIDSEWCSTGTKAIAACDAYRLRSRQNCTYPDGRAVSIDVEYFLKFCINKNGYVVSTISVHT